MNALSPAGVVRGLPVAPRRLPVLGHMVELYRDAHGFLAGARERLGPLFTVIGGPGFAMLVVDGEPGFDLYRSRGASSAHLAGDFGPLLGSSLLVHDGAEHRRMRSAMNPAFTPGGLTAGGAGRRIAEILAPRIEALVSAGRFEIVRETREAALDVIFGLMGIETHELPEWRHRYEEFSMLAVNLPLALPGLPRWRGLRGRTWIDARLAALVEKARRDPDDPSLLAAVVRGRDDAGRGLADGEIVDNLRLLALAGHETTASTIAWSIVHLALEPVIWSEMVAEASAAGGPPVEPGDLASFPVATAVFREALRMHPPLSMDSRRLEEDTELHGRTLPAGTVTGIPLTLLARDARRYPEPDRFRPARWADAGLRPTPLENAPFGGGAHFCLGYHVALLEGVHYLAAFAGLCGERGLAPRVPGGRLPEARYLPFTKPLATEVTLEPTRARGT